MAISQTECDMNIAVEVRKMPKQKGSPFSLYEKRSYTGIRGLTDYYYRKQTQQRKEYITERGSVGNIATGLQWHSFQFSV